MGRKSWITVMIITICVTGLAFAAVAADKQKPDRPRVARVQQGSGQTPPAIEATAWIQYDDNTREDWASSYVIDGGSVGNKFTSSWGTFYCDQASAYLAISSDHRFLPDRLYGHLRNHLAGK